MSEEDNTRESFWNIGNRDRLWFSVLASIFFVSGLVFVLWYKIEHLATDDVYETIFNLIKVIGPVGLSAFTLTFFIFEGRDTMSLALERYLKGRFEKGRQEGRQEGFREAFEAMRTWYEDEKANGHTFKNPPPFMDGNEANGNAK